MRECTERERACGFDSFSDDTRYELPVGWKYPGDNLRNFKSTLCISNGRRNLNGRSGEAFPACRKQLFTVDRVWTNEEIFSVRAVGFKAVPATRGKYSKPFFRLIVGEAWR